MRRRVILILAASLFLSNQSPAADIPAADLLHAAAAATSAPTTQPAADPINRIRDEGTDRSQVMATLSYLTDVIGPRLTGSPQLKRANEWTKAQFDKWGLKEAHLEAWGPFGRGWTLRRFSIQIVEPQAIPLIAYPKAWSPGFGTLTDAPVIYLDVKTPQDLEKYRGTLRGAAVLVGPPRELQARWDPLAIRLTDADLLRLANSDGSPGITSSAAAAARAMTAGERQALLVGTPMSRLGTDNLRPDGKSPITPSTSQAATRPTSRAATQLSPSRLIDFLVREQAAVAISPSPQGDGGTVFVASATLPMTAGQSAATQRTAATRAEGTPAIDVPKPWDVNARPTVPQIVLAVEQYNRLVRMIQAGESLKLNAELEVQFHGDDLNAYNTIAEIPGTDLADQIVMLGAHMDSWHTGTGATDNAAGCAAMMEAVRILQATDLHPRRTIRIALWTGEEEGLLGSKAYVAKHFGKVLYPTTRAATTRDPSQPAGPRPTTDIVDRFAATRSGALLSPTTKPATTRTVLRGPEYDRLSVYFNLDNGSGAIHGVYLQGNDAVRPIFRQWLTPFADVGASTLSLQKTGSTDHVVFDDIGLPGFQFIQDPIEYWSRTHHSNMDVYDRLQPADMKEASIIIATFAYQAAMMDEKLPRKSTP